MLLIKAIIEIKYNIFNYSHPPVFLMKRLVRLHICGFDW